MPARIEESLHSLHGGLQRCPTLGRYPAWDVDLMAYGDGRALPPRSDRVSRLSLREQPPMPNANARYDLEADWSSCATAARRAESTRRGAGRSDCGTLCQIHP